MASKKSSFALACACSLAAALGTLLACSPAPAAVYYWDTVATAGTITGGSGTWSTANSCWSTSSSGDATLSVWSSGNSADFYANGTSNVTVSGSQSIANITFDGSGYTIGSGTLSISGSITANQNATINSAIVGANLVTAGTGILTLGGVNTYSGSTTVGAGTLQIGANSSMELPAATFNLQNGAALAFSLNNNSGYPATTIGGSGNVTFFGESNGYVKTDSANFSYTGTTTVAFDPVGSGSNAAYASALYVEGGTAHGLPNATTLDLTSGRVLFAQNQTIAGLVGTGGTIACDDASHPSSGAATLTLNPPWNASDTFAGTIAPDPIVGRTGTLSLTVSGSGYVYLTGTNTYSGTTTVATAANGSYFEVKSPASLPGYNVAGKVSIVNWATLTLAVGSSSDWQAANIDTLRQYVAVPNNSELGFDTSDGNFTYTSSIGGAGGVSKYGSNSLYLTGNLAFTAGEVRTFGGTLYLSGSNTYGGQVWMYGGSVLNFTKGALSLTGSSRIVCNGGTLQWASGNTQDVSSAIAAGNVLDIFDTNGSSVTFNSPLSGTAGLVKNGAGTLTLATTNGLSGATSINGGTLAVTVNNCLPSSGSVQINYGGTLGGTGGVGNVRVDGALAPGNALGAGTLSAASLALDPGGLLQFTVGTAANQNSFLNVSGGSVGLASVGFTTVNLANGGGLTLGTYPLLSFGTLVGTPSTALYIGAVPSTLVYDSFNFTTSGNVLDVVIAPSQITGGWATNGSGVWSSTANWSGSVPGQMGDTAVFGPVLTGGTVATVTLDSSRTLSSLGFSATGGASYAIVASNGSVLTLASTGSTVAISNSGGNNTIAVPIVIGGNLTVSTNSGASLTVSGGIQGIGSLTTTGGGLFVIAANNTYAGPTNVAGGTLQIGNGGSGEALASTSITLSNGATLAFNHADALTYNGAIGGSGSLIKSGSGLLALTGGNTYNGPTTIAGGTLQVANYDNRLPTSTALTIGAGATLDLAGDNQTVGSLSGSAGAIVTDNAPYGQTVILTTNPSSGATTFAGNIVESTQAGNDFIALAVAGSGILTLTGSNGYSGGTTVGGGTLQLGAAGALGSTSGNLAVNAPGALDLHGFSATVAALSGAGAIDNGASGAVTLTAGVGDASSTFSGIIQNSSGPLSLAKTGAGTLLLSGSNSYSGGTTVGAGVLTASTTAALPGYAVAGSVSASNGATVGVVLANWAQANIDSLRTNATLPAGTYLGLDTSGGNATYSAAIPSIWAGGGGGLAKLGANTLLLTGSNSYSGGTLVNAGVLTASTTAALPGYAVTGSVSASSGATVGVVLANWAQADIDSLRTSAALPTGAYLGLDTSGARATYSAAIPSIGCGGAGGLAKLGGNTLFLTGSNSYTGGTLIAAGTLNINADIALGAAAGAVTFAANSTLQAGASGILLGAGRTININGGATATIDTQTYGMTISGPVNGLGALDKAGSGLLVLGGSNTYAGVTTIAAGTLQIGSGGSGEGLASLAVSDSGAIAFNHIDTLTYSGSISGPGGLIKSGSGLLLLTGSNYYFGGTTLTAGTLNIDADAALGAATGAVTFVGNSTLQAGASGIALAASRTININGGVTATIDPQTYSMTIPGPINGSGAMTKASAGLLVLTGSDTYTGVTTIAAGTLQVGNGGSGEALATQAVIDNGTIAFNHSDTLTIAGSIGGPGVLLKSGVGMLVLTGSNTYTGATTIGAGTLKVGAGGTAGSINNTAPISIASGAVLAFNTASHITLSSAINAGLGSYIGGNGSIVQMGPGLLTISGTNTGNADNSGNINPSSLTISGGSVELANFACMNATILDNGSLQFDNYHDWGFNKVISGSGNVILAGGTTPFSSATNTYSGTTTILSGAGLQLSDNNGDAGSLGSIASPAILIGSGGTASCGLWLSGGGTGSVANPTALTGNPAIVFNSTGGAQSAEFVMHGSPATVRGISDSDGSGLIDNGFAAPAAATLTIAPSTTYSYNGTMYDYNAVPPLGVAINGPGTQVLSGSNIEYSGATTITSGTLQLVNCTSFASTGGLTDNSALVLERDSGSWTLGGTNDLSISGSGKVTKTGAGVMILAGSNTYSGATTISAGTLQIGNGGTGEYLASPSVSDSGTLAFNFTNSLTYSGAISGPGGLLKMGSGTLHLTGSDTYSGTTTITGGTIVHNAMIYGVDQSGENAIQLDNPLALQNSTVVLAGGNLSLGGSGTVLGGLSGYSDLAIGDGALAVGNNGESTTYSGGLSGNGSLVKVGSGALTLAGSNGYFGGTAVTGGTLYIAAAGALPSSGVLVVGRSGCVVLGNSLGAADLLAASSLTSDSMSLAATPAVSSIDSSAAGQESNTSASAMQADTLTVVPLSGNPSAVPEPSTLVLLGIGGISLAACAWRRKRGMASVDTIISLY